MGKDGHGDPSAIHGLEALVLIDQAKAASMAPKNVGIEERHTP